jgi:hypothetical protein
LVALGWSTEAAAVSRPSTWATTVRPFASITVAIAGYGPLCATTPGAPVSAFTLAGSAARPPSRGAVTRANTSGPAVASRVL